MGILIRDLASDMVGVLSSSQTLSLLEPAAVISIVPSRVEALGVKRHISGEMTIVLTFPGRVVSDLAEPGEASDIPDIELLSSLPKGTRCRSTDGFRVETSKSVGKGEIGGTVDCAFDLGSRKVDGDRKPLSHHVVT